jgi:uncharacterized protein YchJ
MNNQQEEKVYILDTNALIGFSVWIPISLNKVFWVKMEEFLQEGKWILLDVIANEIKYENDGLKSWCAEQKRKGLQKTIEIKHRERAVEINNIWKMIDETTGKSTTDTYVIAYAEDKNLSILSKESRRIKEDGLFKIPDICGQLNIPTTSKPKEFLMAIGYKN